MRVFYKLRIFLPSAIAFFVCIASKLIDANLHYSPNKVRTASFILQFHDIKQITEAECEDFEPDAAKMLPNLAWTLSPFVKLSNDVAVELKVFEKYTPQQLEFKNVYDTEQLSPLEFLHKCIAHSTLLKKNGVSEAFCSCLRPLKNNEYCATLDQLYKRAVCLDSYANLIDKAKYCDKLENELLPDDVKKMKLSPDCSGIVTGAISNDDMFLFPLHLTAKVVPKVIDPTIIRQEISTYYLAYKALQRFLAWTDSNLFCRNNPLTFSSQAEKLDDLQYVLPGWESILYFYKYDIALKKYPIAILSQKTVTNNEAPLSPYGNMNYMMIIRNARTTEEAVLATSHRMEELVHDDIDGLVHAGYSVLANALFVEMEAFLPTILKSCKYNSTMKFTIVGEGNLGGGAAAILGLLLAKKFPVIPISKQQIQYDVITFDGSPVGDSTFTTAVASHVNIRNIKSKYFGLYIEPCKTMRPCDKPYAEVEIPTMDVLPGAVEFEIEDTPNMPKSWFTTNNTVMCTVHSSQFATSCWLEAQKCGVSPHEVCHF